MTLIYENEAGKDTLHIAIMDTGSGIRPEVLEKLQKKEPYIDEAGQKHMGRLLQAGLHRRDGARGVRRGF